MLIVGSTGKIGRHLVPLLVAGGARPTVLVRDPQAAVRAFGDSVDVVVADLADPAALPSAVAGQDVVFLAASGGNQVAAETNLVTAAAAAHVERIVKISALGAGTHPTYTLARWHTQIEDAITATGIQATFLRPSMFMDDLLPDAATIRRGELYSTAGDHGLSWIDPADIAAVAAAALRDPSYAGRTLALTGPEVLTYDEVAARLMVALGRPVKHVRIDDGTYRADLMGKGMPGRAADALVEMYADAVRGDVFDRLTDDVTRAIGRPAGGLDRWIARNRDVFGS